jgi:membrane AbrB-like protein
VRDVRRWGLLAAAVLAATGLLAVAGAPSPPLFGGLLGALAVALARAGPATLPRAAFVAAQAVVGVAVGAQVESASLRAFASDWPAILAVTLATLAVSVAAGQLLRLHGASPVTATFATLAGGASGITALARDLGADDRVVVVVQYLRVLVILLTLPVVVGVWFGPTGHASAQSQPAELRDYLFTVLAAALGVAVGRLARMPSPAVLGGLLVGLLVALTPAFRGVSAPLAVQAGALLLIGVQVGLRFTRDAVVSIGRMLPTALLVTAFLLVVCAGLGALLAGTTGVSALDGYLATTPGGLPAVLATATAASGDVTFVSAVQLVRLLLVLLLAPAVARLVQWWSARGSAAPREP